MSTPQLPIGPRGRVRLAWLLAAIGLASVILGLFWAYGTGFAVSLPWPVAVSGSIVGLAIVVRRPENLFGWELLAVCVAVSVTAGMEGYWYSFGVGDPTPSALAIWLWWTVQVVPPALFVFFVVGLPLLFPTGRPPSQRWNWVGWLALAVAALDMAAWASAPNLCALPLDTDVIPLSPTSDCSPPLASPWIWFTGGAAEAISLVWRPLLAVAALGAVASMVARYRNGHLTERLQMKWYVVAMVASLVVLSVVEAMRLPDWSANVAYLFVPAAIAVAILRYRLFDIDRLISRTVSYTIVVGALGAMFAALVLLPGLALDGIGGVGSLDSAPPVVVAGSTLAVAAAFNPLRNRIQARVDLRFDRARYIADRELEAFTNRLRSQPETSSVRDDLITVVVRTVQPSKVGLWSRAPDT